MIDGRKLMFKRSWVQILATDIVRTFLHIILHRVTTFLDYVLKIWPFMSITIGLIAFKLTKVTSKFGKTFNKLQKYGQRLLKFCRSCEI